MVVDERVEKVMSIARCLKKKKKVILLLARSVEEELGVRCWGLYLGSEMTCCTCNWYLQLVLVLSAW